LRAVQSAPGERPSRAEWAALAAIAAIALALRLWNVFELAAHDPFFARPSVDEAMYHAWAQQIAAGDWRGNEVFGNGPLFPYLLALLYAVCGPSLLAARVAEAGIGTLACVAIWWIGRRRFAPAVALGAAACVAVSRMLILLRQRARHRRADRAALPAGCGAALAAWDRPGAWRWLGAGVCAGIGALARPNVGLVGGLCVVCAVVMQREHALARAHGLARGVRARRGRLHRTGHVAQLFGVGRPRADHECGRTESVPGQQPDANGSFRVPRLFPRSAADDPWEQRAVFQSTAEHALGRPLRPSEVSRFWSGEAVRFAREYPGPWLRLVAHKFALATNAFEPWNLRSEVLAREFSAVLRLPLLGFGVLAPLAVAGLLLTASRWRALVPYYAVLAMVLATLVVFFVLARYRLPAVPVLALFACAGVAESVARVRARAQLPVLVAALAAVVAAVWVWRPLLHDDLSIAYYNLANHYGEIEDWPRAIAGYQRAIAARPNYISAHNNLARAYEASGREDDARLAWERVRELAVAQELPRYAERAERHLRAIAAFRAGAAP
jgi:hypothetical protein